MESPERNFKKAEEISNVDILTSFGPVDRAPFSREGVGIISLPFIHCRDDEAGLFSLNIIEQFHCLRASIFP